jgi:hypothetical protein
MLDEPLLAAVGLPPHVSEGLQHRRARRPLTPIPC